MKRSRSGADFHISEQDFARALEIAAQRPTPTNPTKVASARIGGGQTGTVRLRGAVWRLHYRGDRGPSGKRTQHSVRLGRREEMSLEQARVAALLRLEQLVPPLVAPGSTCTWSAWCDRFCAVYLPSLRLGSRRTVGSIIRRHVRPAFAELQIHEIRTARVQTWIASMQARGAAAETIATRFSVLSWLMRRARGEGLAAAVPSKRDVLLPRSDRPRVIATTSASAFSTDELYRILAHSDEPWQTLYKLLAFCGLRVGEGLGLRWCDVDLDLGRLRVVRQASEGREVAPKTDSSVAERCIPPKLLEHLRVFHLRRADDGLLFPSPRGGVYDDSGLRRHHLAPLLARLGIEGKSFHGFRHWFGSVGASSGIPQATLQRAMRHGDLRSTQRYITVTSDAVDQAIADIESRYLRDARDVLSTFEKRNGVNSGLRDD